MDTIDERKKHSEFRKKALEIRDKNDLKTLMATPQGRRFFWGLLNMAGLYRTSFTGDNATFFNEGMRNLGLNIQARLLEAAESEYFLMIQEAIQEDKEQNEDESDND